MPRVPGPPPPLPDPSALERAAAAAWRAAVVEEREGWLLRCAPRVPYRRSNSALPFEAGADVAVVERFYGERGVPAVVAVAPAERHARLDADLDARGWGAEGPTRVLVRRGGGSGGSGALPAGVAAVDPAAWPDEPLREDVLAHSAGEVLAFAEGQDGAVLCIRTGGLAGVFKLHVAPDARRRGVASRLLAACATVAPVLYAQVEESNEAAAALFAQAGFTASHSYRYRRAR